MFGDLGRGRGGVWGDPTAAPRERPPPSEDQSLGAAAAECSLCPGGGVITYVSYRFSLDQFNTDRSENILFYKENLKSFFYVGVQQLSQLKQRLAESEAERDKLLEELKGSHVIGTSDSEDMDEMLDFPGLQ